MNSVTPRGDSISGSLVRQLVATCGEGSVITDPELRASFETDWTGRYSGEAAAVVLPSTTDEVAGVLRACSDERQPVIVQGGNTGLVGGGVPRGGEVIMSMRRLQGIGDISREARCVDVSAGTTLAALQRHVRRAELDTGLDLASRESATLGGIVATNAAGARAMRYGSARSRLVGITAVMVDGTVVDRARYVSRESAGYATPELLAGSEGTLAAITHVRWRLEILLRRRFAALIGVSSLSEAHQLTVELHRNVPSLEAADFVMESGLQLVTRYLRVPSPLSRAWPVYLILESAFDDTSAPSVSGGLAEALMDAEVDAVIADDTRDRARLWRIRDSLADAIAAIGVPHKVEVGVPGSRLDEFCRQVTERISDTSADATAIVFGHCFDGTVHVNVLHVPLDDDAVDDAILRLAIECGGTISAEHGVGVAKRRWLKLMRGEGDMKMMAAIKRALDPLGLLNPGVVLEAHLGEGRSATTPL
jgi:FAD/FMN-containing dehydrogenase